jgi:hypothetical protein
MAAITALSCRDGGVTIFARADTRARTSDTSRRQSRVLAIMDALPGQAEIDSAAASISFGQEQTVRAVALLCRGATANGIVSHLPGRMLAPLGMAGAL